MSATPATMQKARPLMWNLPSSWAQALAEVLASPASQALEKWLLEQEQAGKTIYPPIQNRGLAFALTPLEDVRVVILGQDPYHGPGQAHGLAFSVPEGIKIPPSLKNIYKELEADCGILIRHHGNLENWAKQGVLLLNNALSVEQGKAGAHQKKGWEAITDAAVAAVVAKPEPCVFMLWGDHAQKKAMRVAGLAGSSHHLVLHAPHPSPLSAYKGFFGCRHFSQANAFLKAHGRGTIDW